MISTIIITYNESDVIETCLKSLEGFTDEIIVVDSFSSDDTVKLAKKYDAKVYENKLTSFAEQRNIGLSHAKGDFVFYIDADEELTSEFRKEASSLVSAYNSSSDIAGYFIRRKTYYFGKNWGFTDRVQRLFYKKKLKEWYGVVHETPAVEGKYEEISAPVFHKTHRNLSHMIEKTNNWSQFEAELRLKANHPPMSWWRFPRVMVTEFMRSYIKQKGFKNGTAGIVEGIYQSFSIFVTYAKLWELQNKK